MKTTTSYNSTVNQEIKGKFVQRDVIQNVNELITHLMSQNNEGFGSEYTDELYNLASQPNYIDAAEDEGWEYNEEAEEWQNEQSEETYISVEELCDEEGIEPYYREAYEFWSVSEWLGNLLKQKGEIVEEVFGLTVWGRCTTGQAILLDHVISEICEDLEILEGQASDWSKQK